MRRGLGPRGRGGGGGGRPATRGASALGRPAQGRPRLRFCLCSEPCGSLGDGRSWVLLLAPGMRQVRAT